MFVTKKWGIALAAAISLILAASPPAFGAGSVSTYAGSGEPGAANGALPSSSFFFPYSMAWDGNGGMIVVDSYNNLIRQVKDGKVSTLAGEVAPLDAKGLPAGGYVDGQASKARFDKPRYAAADSKGNIYVSDTGNHVIRKLSGGMVYTFAGSDEAGYKDGKGIEASFNTPAGLAVDRDDNLYVADSLNHVIRRITPEGVVTTYAGAPGTKGGFLDGAVSQARFNEPSGLAMDAAGCLYVLDSGNQLVRTVKEGAAATLAGEIGGDLIQGSTYVQGGLSDGSKARFNFPKGIDVADDGTVFIADTWNHAIRAITPDGETVTLAGSGQSGAINGTTLGALFNSPTDVKFRSGQLYVADMWNNSIRVMTLQPGKLTSVQEKEELLRQIPFLPYSDQIQVWTNNQYISFPDTQPYLEDGKTFVPLRFICEAWGAEVTWDGDKQQVIVKKGNDSKLFGLNGESVVMQEERTMVHIRVLAERLGFWVQWVPDHNAVVITTGQ
ncbi:MAG: copper amine oxidase [Paenibacillaceae bacterium]|nr:copper amine oxidase [Paenibacillaceae bacterium]